jgi:hypothetical protein
MLYILRQYLLKSPLNKKQASKSLVKDYPYISPKAVP